MQILINPIEVTLQASSNRMPFSNDYILDVIDVTGNKKAVLCYEYTCDSVLLVMRVQDTIYKASFHKSNMPEKFELVIELLLNQANLTMVKNEN